MKQNEIGFIGGIAKVRDIREHGLVEASHRYWSNYTEYEEEDIAMPSKEEGE